MIILNKLCVEKDLTLVGIDTKFVNNKNRRCVGFLCNKHQNKGIQWLPVEKLENKKPCQYCNHTKLKETFKEEMKEINPDIIILSDYVNWDTKIKCKCVVCGHEWDGCPSVLLYGGGCKICGHKKRWDSRGRKTTKDIISEVKEVSPNIEILGEYTGCHNKIDCRCKIHNTEWNIIVSNLLTGGTNCEECQLEKARSISGLDANYVYKKIKETNKYINILSKYENVSTKMNFYCEKHEYTFSASPSSFLYKDSLCCPLCMCDNNRNNKVMPDELYKYYVEDVYGYIYKGSEQVDGRTMISFMCKKHTNKGIQKIPFHNIKSSKQCCRYCTGVLRDTDDFKLLVEEKELNVEILGEYISAHDRIECKCKICNHIWSPLAYNILSGFGCPNCKKSNSEKKIAYLLEKWNILFEAQKRFDDCVDKLPLPFDFYLYDYNIAIEYDGEQHYMPVNWSGTMSNEELEDAYRLVQYHDEIKTQYCQDNNINLIRIPYWEKNNITSFLYDCLVKLNIIKIAS